MPTVTLKKEEVRNLLALPIAVLRVKHHVKLEGHENCPYVGEEEKALESLFKILDKLR